MVTLELIVQFHMVTLLLHLSVMFNLIWSHSHCYNVGILYSISYGDRVTTLNPYVQSHIVIIGYHVTTFESIVLSLTNVKAL